MFHFENTAIWTCEFSQWVTPKYECCLLGKVSLLDFQQYNHCKYKKICLCVRMLVLEWKERAFIEKMNSRCFCWFPAAILVHQNGIAIWTNITSAYKALQRCVKRFGVKLWATKAWELELASSTGRFPIYFFSFAWQ